MASANLLEDPFLSQVERVSEEIKRKFSRAHQVLAETEAKLLSELNQLVSKHQSEGLGDQIKQLCESKKQMISTLTRNDSQEILQNTLTSLDDRINELVTVSVEFDWDVELEERLSEIGEIIKESRTDYSNKGEAVMVACKHQYRLFPLDGEFYHPTAIAIDSQTQNVYICDEGNNQVQVFNESFEFKYRFWENMDGPSAICISQDMVYVTQFRINSLNVYSIEGKLLQSVGRKSVIDPVFDSPIGIAISTSKKCIYICDSSIRHRIQCLDLKFAVTSYINNIPQAIDIKLTRKEIIILKQGDYCISIFNYSHQFVREMVPCGEGMSTHLIRPFNFCLDQQNNILLTDRLTGCVIIFSSRGKLMHKFGKKGEGKGEFLSPRGIVLDSNNRIIVVSQNPNHCIQLF